MKKTILATVFVLAGSLAFAQSFANRMVDGFINGSGGNYAPANIASSSGYVNQEVAEKAFEFCKSEGKKPVEVYDINVQFHSRYLPTERIKDVLDLESQENPIWSFTARVVCR